MTEAYSKKQKRLLSILGGDSSAAATVSMAGPLPVLLLVLCLLVRTSSGFVVPHHHERHHRSWSSSSPSSATATSSRTCPRLFVGLLAVDNEKTASGEVTTTTTSSISSGDGEEEGSSSLERLRRLAKTTSRDPSAIQQASDLVDELMEEEGASSSSSTQEIYNLLLEVCAYSQDHDGAERAETVLLGMLHDDDDDDPRMPEPNLEAFGLVMEAWTRRRRLDKVEEVFQLLMGLQEEEEDDDSYSSEVLLKPDIYIYNKLIKAYGVAGEAEKAEAVLNELLEEERSGEEEDGSSSSNSHPITPNYKTWVHVIRAYSSKKAKYRDVALEKIRSLVDRMDRGYREQGHDDWDPTAHVEINNALLRAASLTPGGRAKEAEAMLYDLIELHKKKKRTEGPPIINAESFYHVILAFRNEADASVPVKLEKLIELQKALMMMSSGVADQNSDLRPTVRTYRAAMSAMTRSRDPQKAIRAKKMMDAIRDEHASAQQSGSEDESAASAAAVAVPDLATYKYLLKCCAYTSGNAKPETKLEVFKIAVAAFNDIRDSDSDGLELDSSAYGLFLKACGNLLPRQSRKRDAVVEGVFKKCCQDGHLNDFVLREFEAAASNELQLKMLGGFLEDGVQPPKEWSRNTEVPAVQYNNE